MNARTTRNYLDGAGFIRSYLVQTHHKTTTERTSTGSIDETKRKDDVVADLCTAGDVCPGEIF